MSTRFLTDAPFHVMPELRGAELASPVRRFLAMALDYVILLLPSVAVGVAVAAASLKVSDPQALAGMLALLRGGEGDQSAHRAAVAAVLPLLVHHQAPGLPPEAIVAVERGDLGRAVDLLEGFTFAFNLTIGEFGEPPLPPRTVRIEIGHLIPKALRALALYGVLALYFTIMTSRGGRTLGKRLVGIRVVRVDGHHLSLVESLERFAGYLHLPASLGLSLIDLWRDPNRRLPHDRVVHTAVLRVEKDPRPGPPAHAARGETKDVESAADAQQSKS